MPLCRLCAKVHKNGVLLFGSDSGPWDELVKSIFGYLGLEFNMNTMFPKWLCGACQEEAVSANKFLQQVSEGQKLLRKQLESVKQQVEDIDEPNHHSLEFHNSEESDEKLGEDCPYAKDFPLNNVTNSVTTKAEPSKRIRRRPRRFLDYQMQTTSPSGRRSKMVPEIAYIRTSGDYGYDLVTQQPIAELRNASGSTLAEVIEVDEETQYSHMRLVCKFCREIFNTEALFRKHIQTHNICAFECSECLESFKEQTLLDQHQKEKCHKGLGMVECLSVGTLNERNNLPKDLERSIGDDERGPSAEKYTFLCLNCSKAFDSHYAVRRHYRQTHNEKRSFHCQQCSASFKYKTNYDYHLAKHTNTKPYKCTRCEKSFVLRYELKVHMRSHTGEKPYKCSNCNKDFAHRSNLVAHRRLHTGSLPFRCVTCNSTFNRSSHLSKHHLKCTEMLRKDGSPLIVPFQEIPQKSIDLMSPKDKLELSCENTQQSLTSDKIVKSPNLEKIDAMAPFEISSNNTLSAGHTIVLNSSSLQSGTSQSPPDQRTFVKDKNEKHKSMLKNSLLKKPSFIKSSTQSLLKPRTTESASETSLQLQPLLDDVNGLPTSNPAKIMSFKVKNTIKFTRPVWDIGKAPTGYRFQCKQCCKYFKQNSTLVKHQRTHTGEKPYKCPLCPKAFADPSNFKKHKILHRNAANALNAHLLSATNTLRHQMCTSPTPSSASDPDPDGLEIMQRKQRYVSDNELEESTFIDTGRH